MAQIGSSYGQAFPFVETKRPSKKEGTPARYNAFFAAAAFVLLIVLITLSIVCFQQDHERAGRQAVIAAGILTCGMIAAVIKVCQVDTVRRLTQYYRDETGCFYRVKILRGVSITAGYAFSFDESGESMQRYGECVQQKAAQVAQDRVTAQDGSAGGYYVARFRRGIRDWNWLNGGEAKVTPLPGLRYRFGALSMNWYTCKGRLGLLKWVRIPKAHIGLAEAASETL